MVTPSAVPGPKVVASAAPSRRNDPPDGRQNYGGQVAAYASVLIISFISVFPLYWMVVNSFRSDADISNGIAFWPESWHFDNYSSAWTALAFPFQTYILNSFVVSTLVVIGVAASSLVVAYGFARFDFAGRGFLFGLVISTTMIPYAVMMIPQYAEFINVFHWGSGGSLLGRDNAFQFLPLIVPAFFGSPIYIFLLRQFIRGIPYDLDEAAKIDGAGPFGVLWSIILPAVRPALAAVIVLQFIGAWNDLLAPFIYLQDPQNWTIEIALLGYFSRYASSTSGSNWAEFMAMALVTMLPIVVLYLSASKQIIEGVTLSGVKG
jgi:ABC-type glycerol-3-phosphate transport system permease component